MLIRSWQGVVIHHTASPDVPAKTIDEWHKARGWRGIGYAFVIRKDGSLELGRPLDKVGAHCAGFNDKYIGICLTGNFQEHPPSLEQYKTLKAVLKTLMASFEISPSKIFLHKDLKPTLCPGRYFNLPKIT